MKGNDPRSRAFLGGLNKMTRKSGGEGRGGNLKRMVWVYVFAKTCSLPTCSFKTEKQIGGKPWLKVAELLLCVLFARPPWALNLLCREYAGHKCCGIQKWSKQGRQCQEYEIRGGKQREWEMGNIGKSIQQVRTKSEETD